MLCRALLAAIAISYLVCVLFLSGIQKEDLDVTLLKKLQHHNIDLNDPSLREQCVNKSIPRSDRRSQEDLHEDAIVTQNVTVKEKVANTENATTDKYSDEFNITSQDFYNMLNFLTFDKSEAATVGTDKEDEDTLSKLKTDTKKDNISKTISETKSVIDKNSDIQNQQIKLNSTENHQQKLESLQNIIRFWEEFNKKIITTATPTSTRTKITITQTEATSTTASSVTETGDPNNNVKTNQLDEVERISKLVAEFILSKKSTIPAQTATEHKQTISTTFAPLDSTLMNPREIEEKFALSLSAINKLNENIAILEQKLQPSVLNKSKESEETTSKLAEGVMIIPRNSVVQIAQNLENEKLNNQNDQNTLHVLQNKHYKTTSTYSDETFKREPDYDCTSSNKFPIHVPITDKVENSYKLTPQTNLNTVDNTKEEFYRASNRNSIQYKENRGSAVNHNNHNESLKSRVSNMVNYPYNNPNAANPYYFRTAHYNSGNIENLLDVPLINKHKIETEKSTATHQKSHTAQHSPSHYNSNTQNVAQYEKGSSNLELNGLYNLETVENDKVLHYPYENVFLNKQTPIRQNESRYYKINHQLPSDDNYLWNFEEKPSTYAQDIEGLVDNFKNRKLNQPHYNLKAIINDTSLQVSPAEVLDYHYENALPNKQTLIDQNNNSNFKTNQQYVYNNNTDKKFKYSEEQTTAVEKQIAIDNVKKYNGQLNQPQYKYVTEKIYLSAVQTLSKDRIAYDQTMLNNKKESNKDVSLPRDMLNQIAESVKQIILKDLKNEINTSLSSAFTSSPSTSYHSATDVTPSNPGSSAAISSTITATTLTTIVPSTLKNLSLNETKPQGNKSVAISPISTIVVSTPRNKNLTDTIMEQKIDRVQQATQAIEKFLDLFNKYSAAAQEKTNTVNEKHKHLKLLPKIVATVPQNTPVAMFPPPLPVVNPYHAKPVVIHHYIAPQIPPPPVPINLIPGLPVIKPLHHAQKADPPLHLSQPIMMQTNINEIQPIRVPIVNLDPMNVVMPKSSPFRNQEERNRWNFMTKYGRNPDKIAEIRNTKESLDTYSHVKSIQYSSPNYINSYNENADDKKIENIGNKTSTRDDTILNPYYKYILNKLKEDQEKMNKIEHRQDNYLEKKNEMEKSKYQPPELQQNVENMYYETRPDTDTDTQYPLSNFNTTYYKDIAAQFASLNKDVAVVNLNPSYTNMIREFGLNQDMNPKELDPEHYSYNQKPESGMLDKEEKNNAQNNKRKKTFSNYEKDLRFYENMYKHFGPPKVERNYYEDDHFAINSRLKDTNQDFSGQYKEKHLVNHVQVPNIMPTKNIAKLRPSDDRNKFNILPKMFSNSNLHKIAYDPQQKYNSDFLDSLYSKKDAKSKLIVNFDRISDSPLQNRVILTSPSSLKDLLDVPSSFKDVLLHTRIGHPIGKYYDQEETSKYSVNNKGRSSISRGHFGASLDLNNHQIRQGNAPWFKSKNERNEKWQQHKAKTSAILGANRYGNKNSNEGSHIDSDGNGSRYREYKTQIESSDEKPRYNKKPYYDTSDSDKRYSNVDVRGFHEKLEGSDDWRSSHGNIFSRQQVPLIGKQNKSDDMRFKNFLKTQQKVNQMLEKILASKSEGIKSVEAI